MSSVPVYHLSPIGRAAIDIESARIKQELAARRAEREPRLGPLHLLDGRDQSTLRMMAAAGAVNPSAEDVTVRP